MKERRSARRVALDVLYEAEIRDSIPIVAFEARDEHGWVIPGAHGDGEDDRGEPSSEAVAYARVIVTGVQEHHADIDSLIERYADRWAIERMPVVDRTILRIAVYEMLWGADVPVAVLINEAVEMAKSMSTEDSGRFVNGLLGRMAEEVSPR